MGKTYRAHKTTSATKRELIFRDDDQSYASVDAALGDRRFRLVVDDSDRTQYVIAIGKLRGSMRRSERVTQGCIVLVSWRGEKGGKNDKVDILSRYSLEDERSLRRYGELDVLDAKVRQFQLETEPGYVAGAESHDVLEEDIVFEDIDAI